MGAYGPGGRPQLAINGKKSAGVSVVDTGGVEVANLSLAHAWPGVAAFNGVEVVSTAATAAGAPRLAGSVSIHDVDVAGFATGVYLGAVSWCPTEEV